MTDRNSDRLFISEYTCDDDGHAHAVTDEAFKAWRDGGQLVAVCGHVLRLKASTRPIGDCCPSCENVLAGSSPKPPREPKRDVTELCERMGIPRQRTRASHRRHKTLYRLLHHLQEVDR